MALQRVLPSGAAQLIINLKEDQTRVYRPDQAHLCETISSGTILSGVQSRYCVVDTAEQECVAGVSFRLVEPCPRQLCAPMARAHSTLERGPLHPQ